MMEIESAEAFMDATGISDLIQLNHSAFLADLEARDAQIRASALEEFEALVAKWQGKAEYLNCSHTQRWFEYALTEIRALIAPGQPEARGGHNHPSATYGCERCGRRDGLDGSLAHDIWDRIARTREGEPWRILCLWCMDEIAAEIGIPEDTPVRLYFPGMRLSSVLPADETGQPEAARLERAYRDLYRAAELEHRLHAVEPECDVCVAVEQIEKFRKAAND